ncbi:unnamed protein product [Protopolystoma xenopodis]|uniref:Uncharacterized protein n=1 Tax=Protopolystoma xenopodis TaxID=117903 RepID=A0A448X243_9PLAT|nr:unnamed protein product [Protopolystoma xenopodis]
MFLQACAKRHPVRYSLSAGSRIQTIERNESVGSRPSVDRACDCDSGCQCAYACVCVCVCVYCCIPSWGLVCRRSERGLAGNSCIPLHFSPANDQKLWARLQGLLPSVLSSQGSTPSPHTKYQLPSARRRSVFLTQISHDHVTTRRVGRAGLILPIKWIMQLTVDVIPDSTRLGCESAS